MTNLTRQASSSLGLSTFEEFDKLFNNFWQTPTGFSNIFRTPSLDIYSDNDKSMVVEMQTPGFDEKDIDISVRNGVLEIRGEKSSAQNDQKSERSYMMRESHSSFARRVVLPESVNIESISAELDKGILKITMPVERPEAKKIEITTSSQDKSRKILSHN